MFDSVGGDLVVGIVMSSILFKLVRFVPSVKTVDLGRLYLRSVRCMLTKVTFYLICVGEKGIIFKVTTRVDVGLVRGLVCLIGR